MPLLVSVTCSDGYSVLETDGHIDWRWSDLRGLMLVTNTTHDRQRIRVKMRVQSGSPGRHDFRISGDLLSKTFNADEHGFSVDELLSIDPGRHSLHIETDAPRLVAPGDPRPLYFRVIDFAIEPRRERRRAPGKARPRANRHRGSGRKREGELIPILK